MKNLICLNLVALLFTAQISLAAPAAAPINGPSYSVGYEPTGAVAAKSAGTPINDFILTCGTGDQNSTADNYYRCVKLGTQTTSKENYSVTVGKTAYCRGFYYSSGALVGFMFGYGTATVINNDANAPTGVKVFAGGNYSLYLGSTSTVMKWIPIPMFFPASSFPFLRIATNAVGLNTYLACEER